MKISSFDELISTMYKWLKLQDIALFLSTVIYLKKKS